MNKLNKEEYKKLITKKKVKEKRGLNLFSAFLAGGLMGIISEGLINLYMMMFGYSRVDSMGVACLTVILITCMLTAFGVFDNLIEKGKCGLIIPTTGFAHSMAAATMDYKREGFIKGIGSNAFKLAGSAILYGIVSAFFFCILGVLINV